MREILFRGKRISDKKWIAGGIVVLDPDSDYVYISEPYYHASTLPVRELIHYRTHLVDKETVGQYTGLQDKNGKKIFEGDIISTPKYGVDNGNWKNCAGKDRFLVRYADGTYYLENKLRRFCLRPDSTCGIIGNIFDNPELIASKKGADA